jgi:collagenase-like PrtC family protease
VLNGFQTMSGYQYNLINEVPDMKILGVDIARISADREESFKQLSQFRCQLTSPLQYSLTSADQFNQSDQNKQCNGYWHKIAGMSIS